MTEALEPEARLRGRLVAVAIAVVVVSASGVVLDHAMGPRRAAAGTPTGGPSGAWFCPHGGGANFHAWVVMANPGPDPVRLRLSDLRTGARPTWVTLAPDHQAYREVPASDPADATEVEYFGGWVAVSTVERSKSSPEGLAAEACLAATHQDSFLLDEPTAPDQTSWLIVANPFGEDAEFDVVIRTELRTIAPGALSPYVLPAHRSVAFRMNDYALEGPGESTVTAELIARVGRIVGGGLVVGPSGLRMEAALGQASSRWWVPAPGDVSPAELLVADPGVARADLAVVVEGVRSQRAVAPLNGMSVTGGQAKTFEVAGLQDGGVVVSTAGRRPIALALRMPGKGGDEASLSGAAAAAQSWMVMPSLPPSGGKAWLSIMNPGRSMVTVAITLIGSSGTVSAPALASVDVPGGSTVKVPLASVAGARPVSALLTAQGGTIIAAGASVLTTGDGFAALLGEPMKS